MAKLSGKEISTLLEKIRNKYSECGKKYGENKFNVEKFNERYFNILKLKGNVENFLYAEVLALEDLKKDIEKIKTEKLEEMRIRKEIRKQLDDIADDQIKKIASYPDRDFLTNTPYELSKLFGALILYYEELFKDIVTIINSYNDININSKIKYFLDIFNSYCLIKSNRLSGKMHDFELLIQKFGHFGKDYEREEQKFIQEIAVFLNDYYDFLKFVINDYLPFHNYPQKHTDFFNGNINFIKKIITDFRFTGFKKIKNFDLRDIK